MILKERAKLIKEIRDTFNTQLANAGISGLSERAKIELQDKIINKIDYLYFPSGGQILIECITVVPMLLRLCLNACSSFKITVTEHDSAELQKLSKAQLSGLTLSVRGILEKYRDWEEEARIEKEAAAQRNQYRTTSHQVAAQQQSASQNYTPSYTASHTVSNYSSNSVSYAAYSAGGGSVTYAPSQRTDNPVGPSHAAAASAIADLQRGVRSIESLLKHN